MILINNTATKPCLDCLLRSHRQVKEDEHRIISCLNRLFQKHWQFTSKSLELIWFKMAKYNEPVNFNDRCILYRYIIISVTISVWTAWKILIISRKSNLFLQLRFCSFRDNKIGMYNIIYHACSPALRPLTFISRVELV